MKQIHELEITAQEEREIIMIRKFQAPRRLVFEALTRPELVTRWLLGPPGWAMPVCEIELKVGGTFRYEWARDGTTMGMGGVYQEIQPPERLVWTEVFDDDWTDGETLVTLTLEESDGVTTMSTTIRYASRKTRDNVIGGPMKQGVAASYDRLDELLEGTFSKAS